MKYINSLIFASIALCLSLPASAWDLKKSSNGIKVYTKTNPKTNLTSAKAVMTIDAPATKIVGLISDLNYSKNWMQGVKEIREIKRIGLTERYVYMVQDVPVIKDRDFVAKSRVSQNPKTNAISIVMTTSPQISKMKPATSKYVRITNMKSSYTLTPLAGGKKTRVVFESTADPAGKVPASVVKLTAVDLPYKTLLGMKKVNLNQARFTPECIASFNYMGQECKK